MRLTSRWLLAVLPLLAVMAVAPPAPAQSSPAELAQLEARLQAVTQQALRATVCIRAVKDRERNRHSLGSGFIIDSSGLILTCAHVVEDTTDCEVILPDGTVLDATHLGRVEKQDYAMLKVTPSQPLPHLPMGNSVYVEKGDWVVACGYPGGPYTDAAPTPSLGRITRLHRRLPELQGRFYDDVFETDAPLFSGSSGGPLLNLDGRVIGVNGAIKLAGEYSFAIPINEIRGNYDSLVKGHILVGRSPRGDD